MGEKVKGREGQEGIATSERTRADFFSPASGFVRSRYHLKDVIVGKIYFLLVRIKIKHMELSIIRRETMGAPPNQYNESETITKFEVSLSLASPL